MGEINVKNKFNLWLENAVDDSDLIAELKSVADDEMKFMKDFIVNSNLVQQVLEVLSVLVQTE